MLKKTQSVCVERNSLKIVVYAFKYLIAFGERKMKAPQVMPRCEDTEPTNAYHRHIYESHASSSAWMSFPCPLPLVNIATLAHLWCQMSSAQNHAYQSIFICMDLFLLFTFGGSQPSITPFVVLNDTCVDTCVKRPFFRKKFLVR